MPAPAPSRLDGNQVLQGSFDESTGRLRTDSLATVVNADIDVSLEAFEDNVAIKNSQTLNELEIEANGSINVNSVNGALEVTQQQVLTELQLANSNLEYNNQLYSRILPVLANATFLKYANYDQLDQTFLGNIATLSYKEDTFEIAKVYIEFINSYDWNIDIERYILDDDGTKLLNDDDQPLFLD